MNSYQIMTKLKTVTVVRKEPVRGRFVTRWTNLAYSKDFDKFSWIDVNFFLFPKIYLRDLTPADRVGFLVVLCSAK